jgi:hypothetical protein
MPTSAEIRVRQVASKIGLSDANPEILETICQQMRQEFVVEEWQLPALDSFQWKSLQAPIGLAAAVRQLSISYVVSIPTMATEEHNTGNQVVVTPSTTTTTTTTSPSVPDDVNDTVDENIPRLPKQPQKVLSHLLKVKRCGEVVLTEDSDENNLVDIFEDDEEEESVPDRGAESVESLLEPPKNEKNVDPEHSGDRTNGVSYAAVNEEFYKNLVLLQDQQLTEEQPAASVETSSPMQRRNNSVPKQGVNRGQWEPRKKVLHKAASLPTILVEKGNVVDSTPRRVEEDDHTIKASNVSRQARRHRHRQSSSQVRFMPRFSPRNKAIVCIFLLVIHVFVSFLSKLQRSGPPATSEANTGKCILYYLVEIKA